MKMKLFMSSFFTLLYIVAMIRPVMPVITYVVNQDYIAEFLCVNKDKPVLKCNGKCYLSMQLKAQSEKKKENLPSIDIKEYPIGFVDLLFFKPKNTSLLFKERFSYNNRYFRIFSEEFFHPPS